MRLILALAAMLALTPMNWAAETYDNPKALVEAIYADHQPGKPVGDPTLFYSKRLKATYDQAMENNVFANDAAMKGAEFTVDTIFNPFLPDANALLFDVSIGEASRIDDRAVVNVSYHNFDHPRLLSIAMVQEDGSWKVDDVASMGSEDHWLLSWALTYDPLGF